MTNENGLVPFQSNGLPAPTPGQDVTKTSQALTEKNLRTFFEILEIVRETTRLGTWARQTEHGCSPGFSKMHEKMRKHLEFIEKLHPVLRAYLENDIREIRILLKMGVGDNKGALQESMNDPESAEILKRVFDILGELRNHER